MYKNSLDCALRIIRDEGIKGLYKGMGASYLGVAEGTIQWVIYEKLKKEWAAGSTKDDYTIGGKSAKGKYDRVVLSFILLSFIQYE
jgi:solute carrier family 25 protein 33/36